MSITAMKQALEALDDLARYADTCELFLKETHPSKADSLRQRVTKSIQAITAGRQAIEQAEKREWVGLTLEEVQDSYNPDYQAQTRAVEATLKERNT